MSNTARGAAEISHLSDLAKAFNAHLEMLGVGEFGLAYQDRPLSRRDLESFVDEQGLNDEELLEQILAAGAEAVLMALQYEGPLAAQGAANDVVSHWGVWRQPEIGDIGVPARLSALAAKSPTLERE